MGVARQDWLRVDALRQSERARDFFSPAGTRVIQSPPRHAKYEPEEILAQRESAADGLLRIVKDSFRIAKKSRLFVPADSANLIQGISIKSDTSLHKKARDEYGDDPHPYSRVVDMVRCTILSDTPQDIQILSEHFRPCAMPTVVRFKNDFARVNAERGNIRRLHINVRVPDSDGHVAEIFVYFGPAYEKYETSRQAYGHMRTARAAEERAVLRGLHHKAVAAASKIKAQAARARVAANDLAALDVRDLVVNPRFFSVNDFPVVVVESAYDNMSFALVPNPASGFWAIDQRFLKIIEDDLDGFKIDRITPYEVSVRAQALIENTELRQQLTPQQEPG